MDHLVDLDELAARLTTMVSQWERTARVGPFTWRDANAAWPKPITQERSEVDVPESLGVRLRLLVEPDDEAEFCVWTGGWADVILVMDGDAVDLCPEFTDVDGAYAAVVRTVEDFLA